MGTEQFRLSGEFVLSLNPQYGGGIEGFAVVFAGIVAVWARRLGFGCAD